MKFTINKSLNQPDITFVGIFEDTNTPMEYIELISILKTKEIFKGAKGDLFCITDKLPSSPVLLIGLGKENELTKEKIKIITAKALKKASEFKISTIEILLPKTAEKYTAAMAESLMLTDYKFTKYKKESSKSPALGEINFQITDKIKVNMIKQELEEATIVSENILLARELVNEPANVMIPELLAAKAKEVAQKSGLEFEVLDEKQISALGMKAYEAVAMGSINPPRFIILRYKGDAENPENILGFVGKGLTFDTGGYSIKPTSSMLTMKSDMGGGAAVIGAIASVAERKLKINVTAVIAACENVISDRSYKPGDIIGSMAGKTIEILNTDAEGRLTLADATYYVIEKEHATKIVDIATLTGAVLHALGENVAGVVTNDENFYLELKKASENTGERVWQLPAYDDYKDLIKSDVADLTNTGGRLAGTITAGLFIGEFVQEKPWIHIDIAGTSWKDKAQDYFSKGGTGAGVNILFELAKNLSK